VKLNHLHVNVPDVAAARNFYETFFGFTLDFEHGDGVFLKDDIGFQLALDPLPAGTAASFPDWYHFGFCMPSAAEVRTIYDRMVAAGVRFAREYREFGDDAANFYCWAPGPYKLEVSWNR
jgi:catechol 2,3-dioxygenase-like lactoylglutathione lyase family enzyme